MKRLKARHVMIAVACGIIAASDMRLVTRIYSLESDKITENVRMVLITDLHSCRYGSEQAKLIEAIDTQNPDIILLGGDICDDRLPHGNTEYLLKGVAARYPCYYVTGNHEYWSKDIGTILSLFMKYGVTILSGTYDTIELNGQKINICGVDDPNVSNTDAAIGVPGQLEALKAVSGNGYYTVLLAHRPELIEKYAAYDFDLVLSGHAHGGQWRLPGLINGLYAPNQGLFPPYAGGRYMVGETALIVSRGLARENICVPRIFNRPELVVVNLSGS